MLKKLEKSRDKGFTLIEVVIVLAIAALIMLVVLQAVAAANRAQRDTTRKTEAGRIVSLLEQYAANNGGKYPSSAGVVAAMTPYDTALIAKYATWVAPAYVASTAITGTWADALCGTSSAQTYTMAYNVAANLRDYDLAVCTENAPASLVHPSL